MIGILLLAGANEMFDFRTERDRESADNLAAIRQALDPQIREKKRQDMRRFLVERGLEADDEVLARLGL